MSKNNSHCSIELHVFLAQTTWLYLSELPILELQNLHVHLLQGGNRSNEYWLKLDFFNRRLRTGVPTVSRSLRHFSALFLQSRFYKCITNKVSQYCFARSQNIRQMFIELYKKENKLKRASVSHCTLNKKRWFCRAVSVTLRSIKCSPREIMSCWGAASRQR